MSPSSYSESDIRNIYPASVDDSSQDFLHRTLGSFVPRSYHADIEKLPGSIQQTVTDIMTLDFPSKDTTIPHETLGTHLAQSLQGIQSGRLDKSRMAKSVNSDEKLITRLLRAQDFHLFLGQTCQSSQQFPSLCHAAWFNSIFLLSWHDELKHVGISIQFRPRWECADQKGTMHSHVPDVVLSMPLDDDTRLKTVHPEHGHSNDRSLGVPLMIGEYVKCYLNEKFAAVYMEHLIIGLTAALHVLQAVDVLNVPVFGFLFSQENTQVVVGYWDDGKPAFRKIGATHKGAFDGRVGMDCFHLCSIVRNIKFLKTAVNARLLSEAHAGAAQITPAPATAPCKDILHRMDSFPMDDPARSAIYQTTDSFASWLSSRRIVISDSNTSPSLSEDCMEWIKVFLHSRVPDIVSEPSQATLTATEIQLFNELLSNYKSFIANTASSNTLADSNAEDQDPAQKDRKTLTQDIRRSLTLSSVARDLLAEGASPSMWSTMYDALLFHTLWLDHRGGPRSPIFLEYYSTWAVHREIERVNSLPSETIISINSINVDGAYTTPVAAPFSNDIFEEYSQEYKSAFRQEFVLRKKDSRYAGLDHVRIPVLLFEHVKSFSDPMAHIHHLTHLGVAMKSALALYKILALPPIILGVLCEKNIVTIVVSSTNSDQRTVTYESPFGLTSFDMTKPFEVLHLRLMLKNYAQLADRAFEKCEESINEIAVPFLNYSFSPWRHEASFASLSLLGRQESREEGADMEKWQHSLKD